MTTPTTPEGLRQYDHLPWPEAARLAWAEPGNDPEWHRLQREEVRRRMPLLARALDRAEPVGHQRPVPWEEPGTDRPILALDEDPAAEGRGQ
jgi:hypothetical protein